MEQVVSSCWVKKQSRTTNPRKQIKGSKDADFHLVLFKERNKIMSPEIGAQGPMTSS